MKDFREIIKFAFSLKTDEGVERLNEYINNIIQESEEACNNNIELCVFCKYKNKKTIED